jgi:transcription antitermination factor NusG
MPYTRIDSHADCLDPSFAWYAIYTRHQHEKTVAGILTSKGFETLLPLYSTVRNWKDRRKLLFLPLFPCYVFVKTDLERRLDIMRTLGIYALVSNAGQPAAIPPAEINAVRRAIESGSGIEPHPLLKCGDRVRIKCGPLAGIEGFLVRKKNLYRLVLSVETLGKAIAVEVDAFLVERLNGKWPNPDGIGHSPVSAYANPNFAGVTNGS